MIRRLNFDPDNVQPVIYGPGAFCIEETEMGNRLIQFRFEVDDIPPAEMMALAERWTGDLVQVLHRLDASYKFPPLEYI